MNPSGEPSAWQRKLKEDIGENPARFLDQRISELPESPTSFFRARVEGIDSIEVIGAWIAAERKLAAEQGRKPRQHVLDILDQRREWLLEHGERPADLQTKWQHELPDRYRPFDREVPPKEAYIIKRDGERVPWSQQPTSVSAGSRFDSSTSREVATDGQDSDPGSTLSVDTVESAFPDPLFPDSLAPI